MIVGFFINKNIWTIIDSSKTIGIWDLIYYMFSILAALGTWAAVVVAIWKDSIIRLFYHPDIKLCLSDSNGYSEEVDTSQQTPQAEVYNCILKISNNGSVPAKCCEVILTNIGYATKKGNTLKPLKDFSAHSNKLWWESPFVEIPNKISKEILLFHIDAPGSSVTPTASSSNAHIDINGFKLKDKNSMKGYWELSYYLGYENGERKQFMLSIEWTGEWKTRKTEMQDVLHVKLEEK